MPEAASVTAKCGEVPAVVDVPYGQGVITVFASPFGVYAESAIGELIPKVEIDKPLLKPYPGLRFSCTHLLRSIQRLRFSLVLCQSSIGHLPL